MFNSYSIVVSLFNNKPKQLHTAFRRMNNTKLQFQSVYSAFNNILVS